MGFTPKRPPPDDRRQRPESPAPQEPEADNGDGAPARREKDTSEGRLSHLREELELNERREDELLGALHVTRGARERIKRALDEDDRAAGSTALESGNGSAGQTGSGATGTAIEVSNLSKAFRLPVHGPETLKEQVLHPFRSRQVEQLTALDGISFEVGKGEFLGIAGSNGSGKSTLLKILASIYATDEGTVRIAGRVAPFIELGVGLNPELTAYDNVVISGVMMGLEPDQARARFDEVIDFAGLSKFTEMRLKNYSSGMRVRLAFSIMAQVDADVLLIDEVLAVGDAEFQQRCLERLRELRAAGTTIVFVTHAMAALVENCDRALLLDRGRIVLDGDTAEVAERYNGPAAAPPAPARPRPKRRIPVRPPLTEKIRGPLITAGAFLATVVLVSALANTDQARALAGFSGLAVVLVALRGRWLATAALCFVAAWLVAVLAVEGLPHFVNPAPSVANAVGGASYFGTPYRGAQLAAVVGLGLIVAAAIAARFWLDSVRPGTLADRAAGPGDRGPESGSRTTAGEPRAPGTWAGKGNGRLVAAGTALVALTTIPDLRAIVDGAALPVVTSWDSANFVLWDYLVNQGLAPMKDFFYPYGFQWLFVLFPEGPLFRWACEAAILALAAWALWRLSGGRVARVILCVIVLALLSWESDNALRYFAALMVPLTYAAIGPGQHRKLTRAHAVFGAACALAAFVEPDLLLFGAAGAALVLVGEICSGRLAMEPRSIARGLLVDSVPVLIVILSLALVWVATGIGEGSARWFLGISTTSAFAAPDQLTNGGVRFFTGWPSLESLRVALPAMLAAAGLLHALFGSERGARVTPILLAGSGVSLLMLLKSMVRPVDFVPLMASLVLLWSAILLWTPRSLAVGAVVGAFLGATVVSVQDQTKGVSRYVETAFASPVHGVEAILVAFDRGSVNDASEGRFDLERFAGSTDTAAAQEYLAATGGRGDREFAVLGDAQLLYPVFRQHPPYHSELWDSSPIYEQEAMVEALTEDDPPLLVWRRDFFWDGVPYHVRDPLVFDHAIRHYAPLRLGQTADVLRRLRPGEPIDAGYWRRRLGTTVDLGFIPSLSNAEDDPECSGGEGCNDYLMVESSGSERGEPVSVRLRGRGGEFEILLRAREGVGEYPVRLDRLWFGRLLGPNPTVVSSTPGWSAGQIRLRSGNDLY